MTGDTCYRIDSLRVVSETLDGEAMAINMENGNYYAFNETASALWDLVAEGRALAQIQRAFIARYDADPAVLEQAIAEGIQAFLAERLIEEAGAGGTDTAHTGDGAAPAQKRPFIVPVLERHEDMQEMLLADPIHDVDAAGWPRLK